MSTQRSDDERARQYVRLHDANPAHDVNTELGFHVEMHIAELIRRGRTPEEARQEAHNRFGDMERVRRECEELEKHRKVSHQRARMFDELQQDIRWALRSLRRTPMFTAVVVLALALGIGANAAIFSVINAYLFRPLPVKDASRLAVVAQTSRTNTTPGSVSYLNYLDLQQLKNVFDDALLFQIDVTSARAEGWRDAERLYVDYTSDNYFNMLGVKPAVGTMYSPDAARRKEPLIVLDYRYWKRRFAGDPAIVGKRIALNGSSFTVVGVAEESFTGTEEMVVADAFLPVSTIGMLDPDGDKQLARREWSSSRVLVRLRDGVSIEGARTALNTLSRQLEKDHAAELSSGLSFVTAMETMARPDISVAGVMPWIAAVFMSLVGLVMLIACVNVTNLMLARATARNAELAVRRALGASGMRLVRQLVTESLVLATLGLGAGLILAYWATSWLAGIRLSVDFPVRFNLTLDWRVFAFATLVAVVAGLLTGLAPALQSTRTSLSDVLREGGRGGTGGAARRRLRNVLVVMQVAVSLVLLISAGLFTTSVRAAVHSDLGFQPMHLMLLSVDLKPMRYDSLQRQKFRNDVLTNARALPGVQFASLSRGMPLSGSNSSVDVFFDADVPGADRGSSEIMYDVVSDDYFHAMGLGLQQGREFSRFDTDSTPRVAIINEQMARQYWPGKDPLRQQFRIRRDGPLYQVVGVTRNTKYVFINEETRPFVYLSLSQQQGDNLTLQLRTSGDPSAISAAARNVFRTVAPDVVVFDVKTMETHLSDGLAFLFLRLGATIATAIGLLGLIQAVVGLYGVISYGVSQRTREIGIRMALGASQNTVMLGVMRGGLILTSIGLAFGLAIAAFATRYMQALLVGVSSSDWRPFAGASVLLAVVASLSAWLPARRAARLEPSSALRSE